MFRVRPALVLLPLVLAACDANEPAPPQGPADVELVQPLPDVALDPETMQPATISLGAHFRSTVGLRLFYGAEAAGGAVDVRVEDDRLVVTPRAHGVATVTVRARVNAQDPNARSREATFRAAVDVPARITVLRALADTTLRAQEGPGLRLPLAALFRHQEGRPLTYRVRANPAGLVWAEVARDSLFVQPQGDGTARVTVEALDRGRAAALGFDVASLARWCPAPLPGQVDYAQLRDGQTLTFAFTEATGFGPTRHTSGTAVWHVRLGACGAGVREGSITETITASYHTRYPDGTFTPTRDTVLMAAHQVRFSQHELSLTTRGLAFRIAPYHSAAGPEEVVWSEWANVGVMCKPSWGLRLTRTAGLVRVGANQGCNGTTHTWSYTRP